MRPAKVTAGLFFLYDHVNTLNFPEACEESKAKISSLIHKLITSKAH